MKDKYINASEKIKKRTNNIDTGYIVDQNESAFIKGGDGKITRLGTFGIAGCIGIVILNKIDKLAYLGHFDNQDMIIPSVGDFLYSMAKNNPIDIFILSKDTNLSAIQDKLKNYIKERNINISSFNDYSDQSNLESLEIGVDVESGIIQTDNIMETFPELKVNKAKILSRAFGALLNQLFIVPDNPNNSSFFSENNINIKKQQLNLNVFGVDVGDQIAFDNFVDSETTEVNSPYKNYEDVFAPNATSVTVKSACRIFAKKGAKITGDCKNVFDGANYNYNYKLGKVVPKIQHNTNENQNN